VINVFKTREKRHWTVPMSEKSPKKDVDDGQRPFSTSFLTLAATNVFSSSIFRRWLRPTSQILRFRDVGRRQRLFFRIPGRWLRPTSGKSKEKDIGIGQCPDSWNLETLDVTNVSFLKINRR
jgi:hypothetical protein